MKRFQIIFILVFILCTVFNKNHADAQAAFGLKGGLNLANLRVDDPEASYNSRTGYHAGVFVRGKFSKVAVQPEVLLFTQGSEVNSSILGEFKDSFTYLSIPVMVKFYVVSGLNIHVGPQFGFLLDGERKGSFLGQTYNYDIKDYYKNSDISVSLGGGWDFPFGLNVDVRYNIGVQDINDQANGEEVKSRVFQVSLGWNFLK
ncbi:MAG TPA: porin family protein [Cyclobacteriaceae bacterium]|nr:porin family protein [Cyclobacteriaceae bacterium]HRJ81750.1 porin family protein [Cyclobacteriaceae bacterium]